MTRTFPPLPCSRIQRLRVCHPRALDSTRAKLGIELALAACDLEPRAWPAESLLFVRTLRVRCRSSVPGAVPPLGQALRDRVAESARTAARPDRGRIPRDADSVQFANLAEALAVFALSAVERRSIGEWWWRRLWPDVDLGDWTAAWRRHPTETPGALARLEAEGLSKPVVRSISASDGHALLASLVRAFGLLELAAIGERAETTAAKHVHAFRPIDTRAAAESDALVEPARAASERELASFSALAADYALPSVVRVWIAGALGLAQTPWRVRSGRFVEAAGFLLATSRARSEGSTSAAEREIAAKPADEEADVLRARRGTPALTSLDTRARALAGTSVESLISPVPVSSTERAEALVDDPSAPPSRPPAAQLFDSDVLVSPEPRPWLPIEKTVSTAFGGVFYLGNAALALELYADFSEPLRSGLSLPFWDFLASAALRLLPAEERAFRVDPLWAFLARMSGRREEDSPSEQGLDEVMPGLERRLEGALGAPPARFLRQTAVVVRSGQRIEVHFALALHPIEVRIAGLDRDPGWIPAAGSEVWFVYE